jgi:hypothetical protein
MSKPDRSCVMRLADGQARIPGPAGEHAVIVLRRGPLDVALSIPQRPSQQQTPHAQDELYFIIHGRGFLLHDSKRDPKCSQVARLSEAIPRQGAQRTTWRFGGIRIGSVGPPLKLWGNCLEPDQYPSSFSVTLQSGWPQRNLSN